MKQESIRPVVEEFCKSYDVRQLNDLKKLVRATRPDQLISKNRLNKRAEQLREAEGRASVTAKERILGVNDLVDMNYLIRALQASQSVARIILRDDSFREVGYATGFKVSPHLLLTNHHVFDNAEVVRNALIEFDFELDLLGNPKPSTRFALRVDEFYHSNKKLDYALVAVDTAPVFGTGELNNYGFLRLKPSIGKINVGEFATIIQHPSGQPKQLAIRENEVLSIDENILLYQSDTAQGSSGSPVFNDSWQVVGLHHSGVPKTDAKGNWLLKNGEVATRFDDDADIDWVANAGIRASRIVNHVLGTAPDGKWKQEFEKACRGEISSTTTSQDVSLPTNKQLTPVSGNQNGENGTGQNAQTIDIPLTLSISTGNIQLKVSQQDAPEIPTGVDGALEKKKEPYHDTCYCNRKGYNAHFLGTEVPLPRVYNASGLSKMENGEYIIPYEHFSIVNHRKRKLALFAASNVDASPSAKAPDPDRVYTRAALAGFDDNDREEWFPDPRIPLAEQLSDEFYNKDRTAFDKGHIIRRDDVAWGNSYEQVRRANGDSYHITNCSPQVKDFNRSNLGGIWGKLENEILKQAKTERYCVFSGPVLLDDDPVFKGTNFGEGIEVQIPRAYWKIIIARTEQGELQSFGFLLAQDLTQVAFEFDVKEEWSAYMVSIDHLQEVTINIAFPSEVREADQYQTLFGEELRNANELHTIDLQQLAANPSRGLVYRRDPQRDDDA